ncbi:MAG: NADH-quinone oxidoreductase subunit N [Actinomycetota bacterium]
MTIDLAALAPELILTAAACSVLVVDLLLPERHKSAVMPVSVLGVLATLLALLPLAGGPERITLGGMFVVDRFAVLLKVLLCAAALLVLAISHDYLQRDSIHQGEYYFLILCSLLGMLTIASSRDLIPIFVSLELVSVPTFVLTGLRKGDVRSNEAALKFFLFGILSTAVMLFGMSIIYGITGTTNLAAVADRLADQELLLSLATLSIFFVVVGFGFKISAFPFQWWVPDTYEGAPVPVAAFLSVASKIAGFVGLLQILFIAFIGLAKVWSPFLALVAVLTMTFGNLVALQQRHLIRLLAYSSIGQAGYILLPLGVASATNPAQNREAFAASVVYLLIYAFMEVGAFAVAAAYGRRTGGYFVSDYAGLFNRSPALALAMTAFMFSLAGIPPFAGWAAKFFVFRAVINGGGGWLAAIMAINTVIALFYYAGVARQMFFEPAGELPVDIEVPSLMRTAIAVSALVVVVVGVLPDLVGQLARISTLV